jgi:hypothetical protein
MGGFGHPGFGWGGMGSGIGMMGGGFERPVEETVVNNYYDQPGGQDHGGFEQGGERHFHESADPGGAQLSVANYETSGDDQGNFDNSGFDTGSQDDNVGFDDGGSFDSGGGDLI